MNHFIEMGRKAVRGSHCSSTISAGTQGGARSFVGKIRGRLAQNRRALNIHPKDSDLVVDPEKFRVI
jgi:hypothetical protein